MSNWGDQQGFSASNRRSSRSRSRSREANQENKRGPGRPKASMPKEKKKQSSSRQVMIKSDPKQIGIQLSCAFLSFFQQIKKRKGLIMKPEDRVDLQRQQRVYQQKRLPRIEWTNTAQWNDTQESDKMDRVFHRKKLCLQPRQIQDLKIMFKEVSAMFGKEATSELYQILLQVFYLCIMSQKDSQKDVQNFFVNGLKNSEEYHFLNFKFSKIARLRLKENYDDAYRRLGKQLHKHISFFLASNKQ